MVLDPLLSWTVSSSIIRFLELAVLCAIIFEEARLIYRNGWFKYRTSVSVILALFALYSLFIIVRGDFSGGLKNIVFAINSTDKALAYLLPLIILPLPNIKYFRSILNVFFYSAMLVFVLWLIWMMQETGGELVQDEYYGEAIGCYLPFFAAFLLCFRKFFSAPKRVAIYAVFGIYLVLMILNARRNVVLSLGLFFLVAYLTDTIHAIRKKKKVTSNIILAVVGVLAIVLSWDSLSKNMFQRILERGFEDSRSNVEILFLTDFASSPAKDWVIGRGMDGTYAQMTENRETNELSFERPVIETGYLNMLLKGGIVYIVLAMLLIILAICQGMKSHFHYIRICAAVLLLYLLDNYTTNPIALYSVRSIILWTCVSLCLQFNSVIKIARKK